MRQLGDGLIRAWLEYTKIQESPELFHKWVATSCVLGMLGRKCWVNRGYYLLYPNEYIFLIGASGKVKKDTAIDIGIAFLEKCPNAPVFFPGRLTGSSLMGYLSKLSQRKTSDGLDYLDASVYVTAQEFAGLASKGAMMDDLLTVLTPLYKSPEYHAYLTRAHEYEVLRKVCVNILGGSTVVWLRDIIPATAIGGGFLARVLLVWAERGRDRRADLTLSPEVIELGEKIISDLSAIGMLAGEFLVTDEAKQFGASWYEELDYKGDDPLGPYYERKLDHSYKIAMALSAMSGDDLVITEPHMRRAKEMLEGIERGMRKVLGVVEASDLSLQYRRILNIIRRHSPCTRSKLTRYAARFASARDIDDAISTLRRAYIKVDHTPTGGTVYTARDHMEEYGEYVDET